MCIECNYEISGDDAFCQICGAKVIQQEESQQASASKNTTQGGLVCACGVALTEGDAFCQTCGTPAPATNQYDDAATQTPTPTHTIVYVEQPATFASDLPEWSVEPPPAAVVRRVARN